MKIIRNFKNFYQLVGILMDHKYSHGLDIESCWITGSFQPNRINELLQFCEKYPELHIVSKVNVDIYINSTIPNSEAYFLAEGSKDKEITFVNGLKPESIFELQTTQDDNQMFFSDLIRKANRNY